MDTEEELRHLMVKFWSIGVGVYEEDDPAEPKRQLKMKPSEVNALKTADTESELEDVRKKIFEANGTSDPIINAAIKKLEEDLDQEMTRASMAMGIKYKIESFKLELARAPNKNQPLSRPLEEKIDKIVKEFKQNLSRPGAYLGFKQRLQTLAVARMVIKLNETSIGLETEVNHNIPSEIRAKMEHFKKALEKLYRGDSFDSHVAEELATIKKQLEDILKSANLEMTGMYERMDEFTQHGINKDISKETESAVIDAAGVWKKMKELKVETAKDPCSERVKELAAEVRKGYFIAVNSSPLKEKVEKLYLEWVSRSRADAGAEINALKTANRESKLADLRKKILEARGTSDPISAIKDMLRSSTLEPVEMSKRTHEFKEISKETESTVIDAAGVWKKMKELKMETAKDPCSERVKELKAEVREGYFIALKSSPLKEKVEKLYLEWVSRSRADAGAEINAPKTAKRESKLAYLRKKILEAKGKSVPITKGSIKDMLMSASLERVETSKRTHEINAPETSNRESKLADLRKKMFEEKGTSDPITNEATKGTSDPITNEATKDMLRSAILELVEMSKRTDEFKEISEETENALLIEQEFGRKRKN